MKMMSLNVQGIGRKDKKKMGKGFVFETCNTILISS